MAWSVRFHRKVNKAIKSLPQNVKDALFVLARDLEQNGPVRGNWPNYGKLEKNRHHCHIKKGQPTYVVVWEEKENGVQLIEVNYVGTHEKAPY
jgi:mRNA-degrading endonuclease RelE of RelBE toxin-antitoxin system